MFPQLRHCPIERFHRLVRSRQHYSPLHHCENEGRQRFGIRPRGKTALVRLTQTGWQSGDEWDRAYEYLANGNAQLLETLRRRFV